MNNILKSKFKKNVLSIGSWITIGHPAIAEILAQAGYDWLVIDMEHTTISIETAGELIRIIDLCGVAPLVRLTSNHPDQIKRVMDAGAHGIIVPMVMSKTDAFNAVSATKYAPQGNRGVGLGRAQAYGFNFQDYLNWQKESAVVIVQIEHIDAVDKLGEILSVPGVDGLIIGPYDLSCSMGIPGEFDDSNFKKVINKIRNSGHQHGVPTGIHIVEPEKALLEQAIKDDYRFIAYSVDMRMLDITARNGKTVFEGISK